MISTVTRMFRGFVGFVGFIVSRARLRTILAALVVAAALVAGPTAFEQLFSGHDVLMLTLQAPIGELIAHVNSHDDPRVDGLAAVDGDRPVAVKVSTRGNTSSDECAFLKLEIDHEPDTGPFADLHVLKIGTHCGEAPDNQLTRKYGRLANENSPLREAFIYRLLAILGVPTLRARPARITYVDTDARMPLVRSAMLLEDDDAAKKRLDARDSIAPAAFRGALKTFSTADLATVLFAEAMIGNFDWCLQLTPTDAYRCDSDKKLWNVLALRRDKGQAVPLIYDFDLAGMVTGRHHWFSTVFDASFVTPPSGIDVEVLAQVQRTRSILGRADLDQARRRFASRKDEAFRALRDAALDDEGARLIGAYLTSFFRAISDDAFYVPVVTREGTRVFLDAAATQAACGSHSTAPVGTVVGPRLQERGGMVQVRLLDVQWRWTGPARCDAVRRYPVWIARGAVEADFPK